MLAASSSACTSSSSRPTTARDNRRRTEQVRRRFSLWKPCAPSRHPSRIVMDDCLHASTARLELGHNGGRGDGLAGPCPRRLGAGILA
jgi:hypothetical protein